MMQIGGDKQDELQAINDQLKLALRDHKTVQTLLTADSENAYAKEELFRLRLLINTLAQNQKLILREIRKKDPEPVASDAAKPKENKTSTIVQAEANNVPNDISSKEKENESTSELKTINPPMKDDSDMETVKIFKKDQSETQEQEMGKSLISVAPLGERPKHVDNMLANNETSNTKPVIASASANGKMENENDSAYGGAAWFLALLELMPTHKLQQELRTTERKRATRQKRSTANHSQFVYDDSWDQDEKKKKKKEKDAPLKFNKPALPIATDATRSQSRKNEMMLARQQLLELESKTSSIQPASSTQNGNGVFRQRKHAALSILRPSKPKMQKMILPKPFSTAGTNSKQVGAELEPNDDEKLTPTKIRKVANESKKKRLPQKKPIDFSVERLTQPGGWNTTVEVTQQRDKSSFASSINSLIQSAQVPSGLSLKIPGLPASLTIERISEQQRVCCMCRKPALITGLFGDGDPNEKISDALTSCDDCGMTYHLSCTRSTSTSNESHVCPHCFTKQTRYPTETSKLKIGQNLNADTETKSDLVLEKLRLISEQEALDKKIVELNRDVTCTFTKKEGNPHN